MRKNLLAAFVGLLAIFSPLYVTADSSYSFVPASPQIYDGTSDVVFNCGAQGGGSDSNYWFFFKSDGSQYAGVGAWSDADTFCGNNWIDNGFAGTFQSFNGGPGDVHAVYADYSQSGTPAACHSSGATYSACISSLGFTAAGSVEATYTLCDTSCGSSPEPEASTTVSTTTADMIIATNSVIATMVAIFIAFTLLTVWILKL